MTWTIQTRADGTEPVADAEQLRTRLSELQEQAKKAPFFVILNAPDGSNMAIGLGRDLSVLSYSTAGGWPAQHVVGDSHREGLLTYTYLGDFSEMPARYAIPVQEAIEATVEFFNSGRRTGRLTWEND
jgi:hypothetical protein